MKYTPEQLKAFLDEEIENAQSWIENADEYGDEKPERYVKMKSMLMEINRIVELYEKSKEFTKAYLPIPTQPNLDALESIFNKWFDRIMEYYDGAEIVLETDLHELIKEAMQFRQSPPSDELVEKIAIAGLAFGNYLRGEDYDHVKFQLKTEIRKLLEGKP